MTIKWFAIILVVTGVLKSEAQVINAASCSASDVQKAFNSVTAATTTVNIPACPAGVGWSTRVTLAIPSGNTNLSVVGAGSLTTTGGGDQTVLVDNYAGGGNPLLQIITNLTTSSFFRLAGITIQGGNPGSGNDKYNGIVEISGASQNVRVDHSHFNVSTYTSSGGSSGMQWDGCLYGVVDHNIWDANADSVNNGFRAYNQGTCNNDSIGVGDQSWTLPTGFGTNAFMFIEDNIFNSGAGNDCTKGGKFVARHNTFNMTGAPPSLQTHPTGGAGRERGCRAWEIYDNTFTAQPSNYINTVMWASSGTGLVWGNTIPSSSTGGGTGYRSVINGHEMRHDNSTYTQAAPPNGWGYCNSTTVGGVPGPSNWDQNTSGQDGYACLDQVGRGAGDLLVGGFSSDGSGSNNVINSATGCNYSSPCAYPRQALEPVYEWADAYTPVPNNPSGIWSESEDEIQNNRDYFLGTSNSGAAISFNGTTGVGAGVLASRPNTCTTGVAYWVTDQGSSGTLYQCSSPNTWTVYYTPYTYPHPLTQADPQEPQAPTGLSAVVN